MALSAGLGV